MVEFMFHYGNLINLINEKNKKKKKKKLVVCLVLLSFALTWRNILYALKNPTDINIIGTEGFSKIMYEPTQRKQPNQHSSRIQAIREKETEPRIILHIGPHKTGTTAIQRFVKEDMTYSTLKTDNVVMPDHTDLPGNNAEFPEYNWATCVVGETPRVCRDTIYPAFAQFLNRSYSTNKDVFIVAEDLDRVDSIDANVIRQTLLPYKSIQIIVSYRRLHYWFKSWYNEIMRLYQHKNMLEQKLPTTFPEWIQRKDNYNSFYGRHTIGLEEMYKKNNFSVYPLHLHLPDGDDDNRNNNNNTGVSLFENLFCYVIGGLPNTCQHARNYKSIRHQQTSEAAQNNRITTEHFYEACRWVLAFKGFRKSNGRILSCQDIANTYLPRLKIHNVSILEDFPLIRVPNHIKRMAWNHTVIAERKYFPLLSPDHYSSSDSGGAGDDHESFQQQQQQQPSEKFWRDLRQEFELAVRTNWYAIDVEKLNQTKKFNYLLNDADNYRQTGDSKLDLNVGEQLEFCPRCDWNERISCDQRIQYLAEKYYNGDKEQSILYMLQGEPRKCHVNLRSIYQSGAFLFQTPWDQWIKKNYMRQENPPLFTQVADKVLVKDWIKSQNLDIKLSKIYWNSTNPNELRLKDFPPSYVLKSNHAWDTVIPVKEGINLKTGKAVDETEVTAETNAWLNLKFGRNSGELWYTRIKPQIFAEEFIQFGSENTTPHDFKLHTIHQKVILIQVDADRYGTHVKQWYNINWDRVDIGWRQNSRAPKGDENWETPSLPEPPFLKKMIQIAETLAEPFPFVRVDLYGKDQTIYFGELTFAPGGSCVFCKAYTHVNYLLGYMLAHKEHVALLQNFTWPRYHHQFP